MPVFRIEETKGRHACSIENCGEVASWAFVSKVASLAERKEGFVPKSFFSCLLHVGDVIVEMFAFFQTPWEPPDALKKFSPESLAFLGLSPSQ